MDKICYDRYLPTVKARINAAKTAIAENPANQPSFVPNHLVSPLGLALLTDRKWPVGKIIECSFLEGSIIQKRRVEAVAHQLEEFANFKLKFTDNSKADIRITFKVGDGSWSYISMDATGIPFNSPTMNYGWLYDDSDDIEYQSVVLHEFMHGAAAALHEHSSPSAGMKWNKPVVYKWLGGSPNFWPPEVVDSNVFETYSKEVTQYSIFDPYSIQLYSFPAEWTTDGFSAPWNYKLSEMDKKYLRTWYPFSDIPLNSSPKRFRIPKGSVKVLKLIVGPSEAGKYEIAVRPDINNWLSILAQNGMKVYSKDAILMDLTPGQYTVKVRNSHGEAVFEVEAKLQ